jgi:hypothetical protein
VHEGPVRSRLARQAAEQALVRVVHHYGGTPGFVLLGGLVPELLCRGSPVRHAGTVDVDVQVNLEVAASSANAARLEQALLNAEFEVDSELAWRWHSEIGGARVVVKFELLADLDDEPADQVLRFDNCQALGAVNLRGTGFAALDFEPKTLSAKLGGVELTGKVNVADLAGFLLAKAHAAYSRRQEKDWYDIAFVLLHNDAGGPEMAVRLTRERFASKLVGSTKTALDDLLANFADPTSQGPRAYASQTLIDAPGSSQAQLLADAILAVHTFYAGLFAP